MNNVYSHMRERLKKQKEYYLHGYIPIFIKDGPLHDEVDIEKLIKELESRLPVIFLKNVDVIYIGEFAEADGKNAVYTDGGIYVTNEEPTTYDMLEDVIHEVAHAVEETQGDLIYGDDTLQKEFLGKRLRLKSILDANGYQVPEKYYTNIEYSEAFDEFLSDTIGYPTLLTLTMGLFASPYGATSLKEYFANGFEKYYLGSGKLVKDVSPILYNKITNLRTESDNA